MLPRDGKSVKIAQTQIFNQKIAQKTYFVTYGNLRQNSVLAVSTVLKVLC